MLLVHVQYKVLLSRIISVYHLSYPVYIRGKRAIFCTRHEVNTSLLFKTVASGTKFGQHPMLLAAKVKESTPFCTPLCHMIARATVASEKLLVLRFRDTILSEHQ